MEPTPRVELWTLQLPEDLKLETVDEASTRETGSTCGLHIGELHLGGVGRACRLSSSKGSLRL
jgi:hypothetical protein